MRQLAENIVPGTSVTWLSRAGACGVVKPNPPGSGEPGYWQVISWELPEKQDRRKPK